MGTPGVLGLGVDVVAMARFQRLLQRKNGGARFVDRLSRRILHPVHELPVFAEHYRNNDERRCVALLAGSWGAKEALFKSLDREDQRKFLFNRWYRYYSEEGRPHIKGDGYTRTNEEFLLSVSHDGGVVFATVLRQRTNSVGDGEDGGN